MSLARRSGKKSALIGVNLGAWLVLEKWMTPRLFAGTDAIDEYTFLQTVGARDKLRIHQRTFITEADFKWMANNGVQAIRIPVGYWIFDGDGPFIPCIGKLDWAFTMAEKYDIEVLVCLHGAPGGQNGRDHSGRIGPTNWYKDKKYRQQTVEVLERLAKRYRNHSQFWGLELLNEPKTGVVQWKLRGFYNLAYKRLAAILRPKTRIVFHDAFTPRMLSAAIFDKAPHEIMMDIHWYHFSFWLHKYAPLSLYYLVVAWHGRLVHRLQRWQGIIVGEWNGIIAGEILDRYPKTQHNEIVKEHISRQLNAYKKADAWFYWSYKTDDRGVFHFRSMVEDGALSLEK